MLTDTNHRRRKNDLTVVIGGTTNNASHGLTVHIEIKKTLLLLPRVLCTVSTSSTLVVLVLQLLEKKTVNIDQVESEMLKFHRRDICRNI